MAILSVQRQVHDAIADAVRRHYGLADVPAFAVEVPPNRALGDLAVTVAFQLARTLRKAPRAIAQDLAGALEQIPGVARSIAAPNGYLNLYLDRPAFLLARVRPDGGVAPHGGVRLPPSHEASADRSAAQKTIVEHTAINPNKAAHIGHLRNAALGDTLVRVLCFGGTSVEVQNYIDDLGVQVADIIVGFRELEQQTLDGVRRTAETTRFDYYCWDLYARVTEWYEADRERLAVRAAALHDLEHGSGDAAAMGAFIVDRIVRAHLKTMARLNIAYDLLTYEGDILRLQFWARAFEILKAQGAVFLQTEGRLAGCWVMRIEEGGASSAPTPDDVGASAPTPDDVGAELARPEEELARPDDAREKVIVRSNGVVTYVGKDLANQFWKFGLLGRDFHYRLFGRQTGGRALWATTSEDGDPAAPSFGHASRIYNVIDSRQMYLQALLSQALRTLGQQKEAENSIHFSYEMVTLSHATAHELGYQLAPGSEEAAKPFVEVSGRKGLGVKIDDLLDLLTDKASAEVTRRNPEFSDEERRRVAAQIAVAAIRYFMLKFSRGKLIVFDIEEALSFEGETGPYLQYAVVRANNIFRKLQEREGLTEADVVRRLDPTRADELGESIEPMKDADLHSLWALVLEASRLDEIVDQVVRTLEFSVLAKFAFGLAQTFNAFYHRSSILNEEDVDRKLWRAAGVAYVRAELTRALDLMGIEVPSRM
jgi:arginyl-tRNA synthetase